MRIKREKSDKIKVCTHCFEPIYLKFNFSYISYDKDMEDCHICQLWKRMRELSKEKYTIISGRGKETGFEYVQVSINKTVPKEFTERFPGSMTGQKFHIMRLFPNNNPTPSRIIGKIERNVFYIFYIDIKGKLYKH